MSKHAVLLEGKIDRRVKLYWLWATPIVFACTIVLIPLIPIYLLIAWFLVDKYIDNIECTLTERTLIIKKGILNKVESTVPLEKITDLQMFQGPVMRFFGLKGFRVETAGQSSGPGGHLVNMHCGQASAAHRCNHQQSFMESVPSRCEAWARAVQPPGLTGSLG